ncbi:uncharacterized protein TTMY_2552 [Thermus thermophilus]|nr:uncharacterized protein TTMY_2552 [Thermus thermophilus]
MTFALPLLLSFALALTPAGTVIRNQAAAEASGERYLSNVAETRVQAVCRPLLSPDGTPEAPGLRASAAPGAGSTSPTALRTGETPPTPSPWGTPSTEPPPGPPRRCASTWT